MNIKLIDEYYYLVEKEPNVHEQMEQYVYSSEDKHLFSGNYEGLYIVDGRPHTGLSTGDKEKDIEFLFKNNLDSDYLKSISPFHISVLSTEEANELFSYYRNGKLVNSMDEYSYYRNGKLISDETIDGALIVLGGKFTGLYTNYKTYIDGVLAEGIVLERKLQGIYRKGYRMTGQYTYEDKDYYLFDDVELFEKKVIFMKKVYYRGLLVKNFDNNYRFNTDSGTEVFKTNSDGSLNEYRTKGGVCYKNNKLLTGYNIKSYTTTYYKDGIKLVNPSTWTKIRLRIFGSSF